MNNLLSMAVLLWTLAPQNQNLPDEFYQIPEPVREQATIIVSGTYAEGRTPCFWMPDGSREWFVDSMFDIKQVYRGEVGNKSIRINRAGLPVNGYVNQKLKVDHKYLVLLRPAEEKIETIKTEQSLIFWDALYGEEIIAIVEFVEKDTLRQVLDSIDFSQTSVAPGNAGRRQANHSTSFEIFKGFRLASVEGCTIVLRNERRAQRNKYVYEVTIPLAELYLRSEVYDPSPEQITNQKGYGDWTVIFYMKDGQRSVALNRKDRKRTLSRGAQVWFGFDSHQAAASFLENFQRAIQICANKQQ